MAVAAPSASVVYTGQSGGNGTGQGAAAILDANRGFQQFLAQSYQNAVNANLRRQQQRKLEDKAFQDALKTLDPGQVALKDEQQLWKKIGEATKYLTDEYHGYKTGDPKKGDPFNAVRDDGTPNPSYLEYRRLDREIKNLKKASDENTALEQKFLQELAQDSEGKWRKDHAAKWWEDYGNLKTTEERNDYLKSSSPLKPDITLEELAHDMKVGMVTEQLENGIVTITKEGINEEAAARKAEQIRLTPAGEAVYEDGLGKRWNIWQL